MSSAALHGMGGNGKTQTAVEYIYRHVDDYDLGWGISEGEDVNLDWARSDGLRWTPRELSSD